MIVIFNHRYEQNLPALRSIYAGRFSHVRFLIPFSSSLDPDVIAVAGSSAHFQGFISQGRSKFGDGDFSHYVFVADDMLLNPKLDETNIVSNLKLGPDDAYIQELQPITSVTFEWPFLYMTLKGCRFQSHLRAQDELPPRADAFRRLAAHGVHVTRFGWKNLTQTGGNVLQRLKNLLLNTYLLYGPNNVRNVVYPLVRSYSDFVVVPRSGLAEFCHLCSVFAAMGIFVESALPTALALAVNTVRVEREIDLRGVEMFDIGELKAFEDRYHRNLDSLLADFPSDALYIHPIKLSRWRRQEASTS